MANTIDISQGGIGVGYTEDPAIRISQAGVTVASTEDEHPIRISQAGVTIAYCLNTDAPTNLVATGEQYPPSITLTWTDNSAGELAFDVERSDDGGTTYSVIDTVAAGVTTYLDEDVAEVDTVAEMFEILEYMGKLSNEAKQSALREYKKER